MKSGYDQFFKNAQKVAGGVNAKPKASSKTAPPKAAPQQATQAENLRQKVKHQKNVRLKRSFPWKLASMSILGLALAAWGSINVDKVEKFFSRIEVSILGGQAQAEEKAKPAEAAPAATKPEDTREPQAVQKKDFTPDEINHFAKLNDRKRELDIKEEELLKMEAELQAQKVEMDKRLKDLEDVRGQISTVLEQKVQTDEKKVTQLVDVYSSMKPQSAAKVFETMDEDLAVEVLGRMKKKNAAEIMNLIKTEKAQNFSEKIAGYKK